MYDSETHIYGKNSCYKHFKQVTLKAAMPSLELLASLKLTYWTEVNKNVNFQKTAIKTFFCMNLLNIQSFWEF